MTPALTRTLPSIGAQPPELPWTRAYIIVPFLDKGRDLLGWDCWGLVCWVLREVYGIIVPSLGAAYRDTDDVKAIAGLFAKGLPEWRPMPLGTALLPGDILSYRRGIDRGHVGLCVAPDWMLHVDEHNGTQLSEIFGLRWGRLFKGGYRHVSRA